jgi:hypothetical protein
MSSSLIQQIRGNWRMGLLAYMVLARRWAVTWLQRFDATFLNQPVNTSRPLTISHAQGWLLAAQAANKGWSHWQP